MSATLDTTEATLMEALASVEGKMLENIISLSDINSGSYHLGGISEVQAKLKALFEPIAEKYEARTLDPIEMVQDDGSVQTYQPAPMQIFQSRPQAPFQILFTGHSDTVFPKDSAFQRCRIDGNQLHGPGTADMKGGLMVILEALRAFEMCHEASRIKNQFGFTIAISPDEEIGSPSSAKELAKLAKGKHVGLTYEPALADGTLAGARKGSGNFSIVVKGKSTHAGREFFQGKNAVVAACELAVALSGLSDEENGITVNVAKLSGGGPFNVVPDLCVVRFNIRVMEPEQQTDINAAIDQIVAKLEIKTQCSLTRHGGFNRPPKPMTPEQAKLFELLKSCGDTMGLNIQWKPTGGCCEGNNLAAAGLVNIDTLGVRGAHIHSDQEYACIDSFVERAQLSALLIKKLIDRQHEFKLNGQV